jgi:hypothetical protein
MPAFCGQVRLGEGSFFRITRHGGGESGAGFFDDDFLFIDEITSRKNETSQFPKFRDGTFRCKRFGCESPEGIRYNTILRSNSFSRGFCMRLSCGHFRELIDIGLLCGEQGGDDPASIVGEQPAVGAGETLLAQTNKPIATKNRYAVNQVESVIL